jgi:hypothetical protein
VIALAVFPEFIHYNACPVRAFGVISHYLLEKSRHQPM